MSKYALALIDELDEAPEGEDVGNITPRAPTKGRRKNLPVGKVDDPLSHHSRHLSSPEADPLSREQEEALLHAYKVQGSLAARDRIVEAYQRLVTRIAHRYARYYRLPLMDLIQEGNLGLLRALENFDISKGCRVITYAPPWIRAYIQSYFLRAKHPVKILTTQRVRTILYQLTKAIDQFKEKEGRSPTLSELAKQLGVSEEDIERVMVFRREVVSLQAPVGSENDTPLEGIFGDAKSKNPEEELIEGGESLLKNQREMLKEIMEDLDGREGQIIQWRFLCDETLTLKEIAVQMGISRERIRQLEGRALMKMKRAAQNRRLDPTGVFTKE